MDRSEYTKRVLAQLKGTTREETEAIRAELDAHMEDHICDLLDLGYSEEVAEERVLSMMGDPEEVGRELNRQYPRRWLVLKWAAKAVTILLALVLLSQVSWMNVWWNLKYRWDPTPVNRYDMEVFSFLRDHPADVRMEINGTVVRVCAAGIMKTADYPYWGTWEDVPDTVHMAAITLCAYSADLTDLEIKRSIPNWFLIKDSRGGGGAVGSATVWMVPVEPRQKFVTATYQKYGQDLTMKIPLDWEGVE